MPFDDFGWQMYALGLVIAAGFASVTAAITWTFDGDPVFAVLPILASALWLAGEVARAAITDWRDRPAAAADGGQEVDR